MHLDEVLKGIKFKASDHILDMDIASITDDSRGVKKGSVFVAVSGHATDGRKYIDEAITKGAGVIICEKNISAPAGVAVISVNDARGAIPVMFDNFYGHPSGKLKVIGVTGTNGKTTITYILESILKNAGHETGVIGTINYRFNDKVIPAKNTTPGARELQAMLAEMVNQGVKYACMEVSSHSLDQDRVGCVGFDAAIFTNITSDHLDYHKTSSGYFDAKKRIFDKLKVSGTAILNSDDEKVAALKGSMKRRVLTYGISVKSDVSARDISMSPDGTRFTVMTPSGSIDIDTKLIGMHNVSNILAGIAACYALDIKADAIKMGVSGTELVPGRLESVDMGQGFKVFVDYAHTEDALNNVLGLLREIAKKKIITVFGCGGDRDTKKRPLMGRAACKFSDRVIITSDNPRFENPDNIIAQIEKGIKGKFQNYDIIADRRSAIRKALRCASDGDIVLIAGKGHEDYQIINDRVLPFDDRQVSRDILKDIRESKRDSKDN